MKKALLLALILSILPFAAEAGTRNKTKKTLVIPAIQLLDSVTLSNQPGGISTTATTAVIATASGCSITALMIDDSAISFVTTMVCPNDYKANGKFYLLAKADSATDTTFQCQVDIQRQQLSNLTSTAVTVGTLDTAIGATLGSQWKKVYMPNGVTYQPNDIYNLFFTRTGTGELVYIQSVIFEYTPVIGGID